jgi:HEAT repeat protein
LIRLLQRAGGGDRHARNEAMRTIEGMGEEALPVLLEAARRSASLELRCLAVELLGWTAAPAAVPTLVSLCGDAVPDIRARAVRAQAQVRDPGTLPTLRAAVNDPDPTVRREAVEALGKQGLRHPDSVPLLAELLSDPDAEIRWRAAEALKRLHDPRSVHALAAALADEHPRVRTEAREGLVRIGAVAVEALQQVVSATPPGSPAHSAAARALADIIPPPPGPA